VIRPDIAREEKEIQRFLEEARASTSIRHRGIVDVFNFGQLPDGRPYMVMEYLTGASLDELISEKGELSVSECLWILDEVLSALIAAHRAGVIHRDLKPSNIFVVTEPSSGSRYTKLLDFGIAKLSKRASEDTWHTESASEGLIGTVQYMAPEQLRAEAISPRTDLYALGCVAYETLTGRPPFRDGTAAEVAAAQLEKIPERLSALRREITPDVDDFVFSLLAKRPDDRPRSGKAAREALKVLRTNLGLVRLGDLSHETNEPALPDDLDGTTYVRRKLAGLKFRASRARLLALLGACCVLAGASVPAFRFFAIRRSASAQVGTTFDALAANPPSKVPEASPTSGAQADKPPSGNTSASAPSSAASSQPSKPRSDDVPVPGASSTSDAQPAKLPSRHAQISTSSLSPVPLISPRQRRKKTKTLNARAGEATAEVASDPQRQRIGYLTIDAVPWAHVKINGRFIRDTPIADYAVREGSVTIEFENPELGKRTVHRFVKAGARESVSAKFE
jgi:serine/threonine protein kinase